MFTKSLIAEFFTTISIKQKLQSIYLLTIRLPFLRYGKDIKEYEYNFMDYLKENNSKVVSFYNGRSAIFQALKIIGIKNTDEVIVSGYTCVSVSNAVIQSGAKVIYSDIEKCSLGLDINNLRKNISKNTKVIIIQHTFGKASKINEIINIAKENNILVIEDCAHVLGTEINGKKLGNFGDFAIFSTGRDKVISSISGGFLLINNPLFHTKIESIKKELKMPSILLTIRNLKYNIVGYNSYKMYDILKIGKINIYLARKLKLITEILSEKEKKCDFKEFYYKLPNSLAYLGSKQLLEIEKIEKHRIEIANYYNVKISNSKIEVILTKENNNYFRFPILLDSIENKEKLYNYMKNNHIILGNTWSGINIVPRGTNLIKAKYIKGTCKVAEDISSKILILPNHNLISLNDAKKIVKLLNKF